MHAVLVSHLIRVLFVDGNLTVSTPLERIKNEKVGRGKKAKGVGAELRKQFLKMQLSNHSKNQVNTTAIR